MHLHALFLIGIGDGPMRELFIALQPLFAPEPPPFLPAPSTCGGGDGLLARYLPLFARLEHQVSKRAKGSLLCFA